jgi:polyphenol oxidase
VSAKVPRENIAEFEAIGVRAFTTTREAGTFSLLSEEPTKDVMQRWSALQDDVSEYAPALASIRQVHGTQLVVHNGGWSGWLRGPEADGHIATSRGVAMAVSIADCVPVFLAHESGVTGLLHSGWRGTAGRIIQDAISLMTRNGLAANEIMVHLGPAICGRCYEVDADVRAQLTGRPATRSGNVDLRSLIAEHASEVGVQKISVSPECTRCDKEMFFSHRAGDSGRQLAVIVAGLTL